MLKDKLCEFIKKYPRVYSQQLLRKNNALFLQEILQATQFLDQHNELNIKIQLCTRCWIILNDILSITQIHKCSKCGKYLIKNHHITDKINNSEFQFCDSICKNAFYKVKKQEKYDDYIKSLTELNIKYWELRGFSYHYAAMKVREYKPIYKEYWLAKGYSKEEAIEKVNNVKNPVKIEYWLAKGYSEYEAIKQIEIEKTNRLKKLPKHKEYWIAKGYSEEDAIEKAKYEYCIKNPTTMQYWIAKGYSEEEAKLQISRKKKVSVNYWMAKGYSEKEATEKAHYEAIIRTKANKEYWLAKGYSEEVAIQLAKDNGNHFEAAHAVFTKKQNWFCKEYWIAKGYSEEVAIQLAKDANRNTTKNISYETRLDAYKKGRKNITDYDKKKTAKKISNALRKKKNTHSPIFKEYWIVKGYSEEDAKKQASITRMSSNGSLALASKIETRFFDELENYLKTVKFIRQKWERINNVNYCQDGRYKNIVIEFNGTNFHMDERFFNKDDLNPMGATFIEVKQKDANKVNAYLSKKYNIIEVWEYDFLNYKNELFLKIKEVIDDEKNSKTGSYWSSAGIFNKCC